MQLFKKILSFCLIGSLLFSTVGIAQVTHLCRMTSATYEKVKCKKISPGKDCCNKLPAHDREKNPCCYNIVKVFQTNLKVVLKNFAGLTVFRHVATINIIAFKVTADSVKILSSSFLHPPGFSGRYIVLSYGSMLI
jgi:hypothetical protein